MAVAFGWDMAVAAALFSQPELLFSWLKCFGVAQLLLEHCTLKTVIARERAMTHHDVQGLWFRSRNAAQLDHQAGRAAAGFFFRELLMM